MGVPVADEMQSVPMHLIYLPLFRAAVWKVEVSGTAILMAGAGHSRDRHLFLGKTSEQLSSGLRCIITVLLMLDQMIQDGSVDDEALSGLSDFEGKRITVSLPQQASHNGSLSQTRSS